MSSPPPPPPSNTSAQPSPIGPRPLTDKSSFYLIYIDESGDCGRYTGPGGATPYFALSGLIIPEASWVFENEILWRIRLHLQRKYGLSPFVELKGSELINPRGNRLSLERDGKPLYASRTVTTDIYRDFLTLVSKHMTSCLYLNLFLNKERPKYSSTAQTQDVEFLCWDYFLQRFQNFLSYRLCRGLVLCDETNEHKIRNLIRMKRRSNSVPSQTGGEFLQCSYDRIIEDPIMRDSKHSGFIQIADLISHALYRQEIVKGSYKTFGVDRLFRIMEPRLLKRASANDALGIVRP